MSFSSFSFLLFLPAVALVYAGVRRFAGPRPAQACLLVASLVFYALPRPSHLPLLLVSILFNWAVARRMAVQEDPGRRKNWLRLGLVANVELLASFKYVDFFFLQIGRLSGFELPMPHWDFPLGISFFTLTQVMYLVDCYQKLNEPISLFDHATVVSSFPYVSSGPIVRATDLDRRYAARHGHRRPVAWAGMDVHPLWPHARRGAGREPGLEEVEAAASRRSGLGADVPVRQRQLHRLPLTQLAGGLADAEGPLAPPQPVREGAPRNGGPVRALGAAAPGRDRNGAGLLLQVVLGSGVGVQADLAHLDGDRCAPRRHPALPQFLGSQAVRLLCLLRVEHEQPSLARRHRRNHARRRDAGRGRQFGPGHLRVVPRSDGSRAACLR